MPPKYHVGQRVSFRWELCTVRWIGKLKGRGEKVWIGVEWDVPTRGKNNGSLAGHQYFNCVSPSPTAASFLSATKPSDSFQSFVEAVRQKYATELTTQPLGVPLDKQIEISGKVVEEVGFDKIRQQQSQLHELKIVIVDGFRISYAESPGATIRETCPKIVEVDLSRNLFEKFDEVVRICAELDHLRSLRLNGNRFEVDKLQGENPLLRKSSDETQSSTSQSPDRKKPQYSTALDRIKDLELDEMLMPWNDICCVAKRFGSLKTLTASSNSLRMLYVPLSTPHLTSLTLEYNLFESLSDLSELSSISTLETLRLKGNYISRISQSPRPNLTFGRKLGYVDLSYNDVADWAFVDTLADVFPGLRALRLSHNPIYEGASTGIGQVTSIEEGYMLTIARLGKLTALNFSNITAADRTNAEMYYLSRIGKAMGEVAEAEEQSVTSQHKRYPELCEKYGAPVVVRTKAGAVNPDFLEARLIKFTFYLPPKEGSHEEPITKLREIPRSFDIYRVKGIVGRMFDIRPLSMRLIWETGEWDPVAGYEEDEEDEDSDDEGEGRPGKSETAASGEKGKWMRREVEIEDGTRQVGFCVDGMEAKVRIELK